MQSRLQAQWEEHVMRADEEQTKLFSLHLDLVREQMEALASEVLSLRDDFQTAVVDAVAEEVANRMRSPMDGIQQATWDLHLESVSRRSEDERLERLITQLRQELTDEIGSLRLMSLENAPADTSRQSPSTDKHTLDVSMMAELSSCTMKLATLEEQVQTHSRNWHSQLEDRISAESARLEAAMVDITKQLHSLLHDLEREGEFRSAGDKEIALRISHTSQTLQQALDRERQERQCMCSLVAMTAKESASTTRSEQDRMDLASAMEEALQGIFASVGSLQKAISREAELRVSNFEELQKMIQSEVSGVSEKLVDSAAGWEVAVQNIWKTLNAHTHNVKLDNRAVSPGARARQGYLAETESSRRKTALTANHSRSPPPVRCKVDCRRSVSPLRSSLPRVEDPGMAVLLELGGPPPAPK